MSGELRRMDIRERSVRHSNSCFFTMVAVDERGHPVPVPKPELEDDIDRQRWRSAEVRRAMRREIAARQEAASNTP